MNLSENFSDFAVPPACCAVAGLRTRTRYLPGSTSGFERRWKRPKLRPLTWRTYGFLFSTVSPLRAEPDLDPLVADERLHGADRLDPVADLRLAVLEALELELDLRRRRARVGRAATAGAPTTATAPTTAALGEGGDREEEHGDRRQHPRGDLGELHGARLWQTNPSPHRGRALRQPTLPAARARGR